MIKNISWFFIFFCVKTEEKEDSELEIELTKSESISSIKKEKGSEDGDVDLAVQVGASETELSKKDIDKKLKEFGEYDPKLDLSDYKLPSIDLMEDHGSGNISVDKDELENNKNKIILTVIVLIII